MRDPLVEIRQRLDEGEKERLSPFACLSVSAVRRREEEEVIWGHRQFFSLDADRILHSLSYSRYVDKTQVFYLIKNDHITHRVLHVQLVSKISRTVGRLLRLNEDLIEAIALGHDIGHSPFGHDGERILSKICKEYGIGHFVHNVQGVRFLERIERKGRGWNLTLQVLDGILCHDGELHQPSISPSKGKSFEDLEYEMEQKLKNPAFELYPMTLEGCVVRLADTISYIGRDLEDAIRLKLISREAIPKECKDILGDTNGKIVYTLVSSLAQNSLGRPYLKFSDEIADALGKLKAFNQEAIYENPRIKTQEHKIELMFILLFEKYLKDLENGDEESEIFTSFLDGMDPSYIKETPIPAVVRDFIAGMTDEYFLSRCHKHFVPEIKEQLF